MTDRRWIIALATTLCGIALTSWFGEVGKNRATQIAGLQGASMKVASLDYCADQYVMAFVAPENIVGVSHEASMSFSYLRDKAEGLPVIRPRAEDILLAQPDIVVRSYGGGPGIADMLARAKIDMVQIGYASRLADLEGVIRSASTGLGNASQGEVVIANMNARLSAIKRNTSNKPAAETATLYLTSKGAVAGPETLIDDLLTAAGVENFRTENGWGSLPLEALAYDRPNRIAAGFFDTSDIVTDNWTPSRHPVAQRALADAAIVDISGAWTACSMWSMVDAVEALAGMPMRGADD